MKRYRHKQDHTIVLEAEELESGHFEAYETDGQYIETFDPDFFNRYHEEIPEEGEDDGGE